MSAKARTSRRPSRPTAPRVTKSMSTSPDPGHLVEVAKAGAAVPVPPVTPFRAVGTTGVAEYGGYVASRETNASLIGAAKWKTLAGLATNVSIVAAGVRRVMGLLAAVAWRYEPADESPAAADIAEVVDSAMNDLAKPWPRVASKLAMFKYNGASLAAWQAKRRPDGHVGFARIDDLPLHTVARWALDKRGDVLGIVQRDPVGGETSVARGQMVYLVDDLLSNGPEGVGLLRHCVEPARDLAAFKKLQGVNFETDLRGIPYFKAPLSSLAADAKKAGAKTEDQINAYIDAHTEPLTDMMAGHVKGSDTGLMLDSATYVNERDGAPSTVAKWSAELMRGDGAGLVPLADAIKERMWEIAIILNVEGMLVGSDGKGGSLAMDISKQVSLLMFVQGLVDDIVAAVQKDLVERLMWLNGWPIELMPMVKTSKIEQRDIAQIAAALRDMAAAGVMLDPNSPAVYEFMSLLGLTWTGSSDADELDAAGIREPGPGDEPEPEDGEDPLDPEDDGGGTEGEAAKVEPEKKPVRKRRR